MLASSDLSGFMGSCRGHLSLKLSHKQVETKDWEGPVNSDLNKFTGGATAAGPGSQGAQLSGPATSQREGLMRGCQWQGKTLYNHLSREVVF